MDLFILIPPMLYLLFVMLLPCPPKSFFFEHFLLTLHDSACFHVTTSSFPYLPLSKSQPLVLVYRFSFPTPALVRLVLLHNLATNQRQSDTPFDNHVPSVPTVRYSSDSLS